MSAIAADSTTEPAAPDEAAPKPAPAGLVPHSAAAGESGDVAMSPAALALPRT